MTLSDEQIDYVEGQIKEYGITVPDLAESLLDHFCCAIEFEMDQGLPFEEAWRKSSFQICPDNLEEINREVLAINSHQKHHIMKKFVFILGFVSAFIFTVGYWFKTNHWPGANIQMIIGSTAFSLAFLPMYFLMKYRIDQSLKKLKSKSTYILNFALAMTICIAVPYKVMELPGANILFYLNCIIFSGVFLPRVFLNWYRKTGEISA